MRFDTIWLDARLATLAPSRPGLGIVKRGAVAAKDGRIAFAGPMAELPTGWDARHRVALDGRWVTPGLVDCHTHLVYAGDRVREFELRLAGASYEEIAKAGGGILSTVKATRAVSEDGLVAATLPRLDCLLAEGVTTVEIKSGYGLDRETEVRMLRAARRLTRERKVEVSTSFLGAHALPPEANGDKERYIDEVCAMIPAIARDKLAALGAAGLSHAAAGSQFRFHGRAGDGGGADRREQAVRVSGQRQFDPDLRQSGGPCVDGGTRRAPACGHGGERHECRCDRAYRGGAGLRLPYADEVQRAA